MKKELNTRQWRLHDYLRECYKHLPNDFINKREIVYALKDLYNPNDAESEHNSSAYALLRDDIRKINTCPIVQKLFVSSPKGYKMANRDDLDIYLKSLKKVAVRKFKLYWTMVKKADLDGQYRITFTPYEKEIIDVFDKNNER